MFLFRGRTLAYAPGYDGAGERYEKMENARHSYALFVA